MSNITKEVAQEMQDRVNRLATSPNGQHTFTRTETETGTEVKRAQSPHSERSPKTWATIGANGERKAGAAMGKPKRKKNTEYDMQREYKNRMSVKYPEVLVYADTDAYTKKTMFQQVRANALKTKGEKWPDTFVMQPSGEYGALLLEFKTETPYKMDGVTLKKTKDDHTEKQAATMQRLRERGYFCDFVWSVEMAMELTDKYLNL